MKIIYENEYNNDGILIDLESPEKFKEFHLNNSINIPYKELMYSFKKKLDKNKKYYLYCRKGNKSREIVRLLELYNYDVTQLILKNNK